MYNYIKGTLVAVEAGKVVLENNGIGYELGVSGNTLADANEMGKEMKLYTYLYVREDVFALYGFSRAEEKTLFMRLIEISGVGPKLAMQILGGYDLGTLTVAIATGDVKTLSKIKGLGKKTAELIVLNLREQVAVDMADAASEIGGAMEEDVSDAVRRCAPCRRRRRRQRACRSSSRPRSNLSDERKNCAMRGSCDKTCR